MKPRFSYPYARFDARMCIECAKLEEPCAHQRWCMSKGWAVLTDQAGKCPARKDDNHDGKTTAATKRRD